MGKASSPIGAVKALSPVERPRVFSLGKTRISGMPSNIYGAVIMWERDDVHSEWLWKAELGYTKFGSMSIFFFFFFMELS